MLTLADDAACRCETEFSDDDERPNRCEVQQSVFLFGKPLTRTPPSR